MILGLVGLAINGQAIALEKILPNPSLKPKDVVEIQLRSLQQNDEPLPDSGIGHTWIFAHPNIKVMTGPIDRFTIMMKNQNYRNMLYHYDHKIEPVFQTNSHSQFEVSITTSDKKKMTFKWELMKAQTGEFSGSWMTTSVSPPLLSGDAY